MIIWRLGLYTWHDIFQTKTEIKPYPVIILHALVVEKGFHCSRAINRGVLAETKDVASFGSETRTEPGAGSVEIVPFSVPGVVSVRVVDHGSQSSGCCNSGYWSLCSHRSLFSQTYVYHVRIHTFE